MLTVEDARCIPKLWVKERGRPGRESSDTPSRFPTHNFGMHGKPPDADQSSCRFFGANSSRGTEGLFWEK